MLQLPPSITYKHNTDRKIISKALATRLESVMLTLIHPDQTGFIKGPQSSNNTHRLFNIITPLNKKTNTVTETKTKSPSHSGLNY